MQTNRIDSHLAGFFVPALLAVFVSSAGASDFDTIGLTALRAREPSLVGSGVSVAMVEATVTANATVYQPNPTALSQNATKFTFFDAASPYPAGNGTYNPSFYSWHANGVATNFFGASGVAPDVSAIKVFEANYFINSIAYTGTNASLTLVNQSFITGDQNSVYDQLYDNYADRYKVLFVNGVNNGNSTAPPSPATMYNGIAVGLVSGNSSVGPTTSGGRSKPDIVAPSSVTSFATPYVTGSAAILLQAGAREDGGNGTASSAADPRTVKALLLNGATKPSGWARSGVEPLDRIYGAGILNVNRSHLQLSGGRYSPTVSSNSTSGSAHLPPTGVSGNVTSLLGWSNTAITNYRSGATYRDRSDNYFFDLPSAQSGSFNATCTLVWNRQNTQTSINNLDFFLYDASDNSLVASGNSTADNVEHLYATNLPAGRYVLQVFKPVSGAISYSETYSVAFAFEPIPPPSAPSGLAASSVSTSQIDLTWTDTSASETGFRILRSLAADTGFAQVGTTGADQTSYSDAGLNAGTTYYYRVTAFSAAGDSDSATASATTLPPPPSAPTGLLATAISSSRIDLSWTDNSSNETGFRISRSLAADTGFSEIGVVAADMSAYSDLTVEAGVAYYYRVVAYSSSGDSSAAAAGATAFTVLESWRNDYFQTTVPEGPSADNADGDADGLPNLIEYALGTNPVVGEAAGDWLEPSLEAVGDGFYLTLTIHRTSIRPGVTYAVEAGDDLANWSGDVTVLTDSETELKVRDNIPATSETKRFLRLRVTAP